MALTVWLWAPWYPVKTQRIYDEVRLDLGSGHQKFAQNMTAVSRADGTGSVSSYKGINAFHLLFDRRNYGGDELFKTVLDFVQARKEDNSAFYFYHPAELVTPDPTAVNTTGRYIVRIAESRVDLEMTHLTVFRIRLIFTEAMDQY